MGWWGYDIMEGDSPLDCEGEIKDFLADRALVESTEHDGENWMAAMDAVSESAYEALKVEASVLNVFAALTSDELCDYEPAIGMQVLGEMIMYSGGVFPVAVRCACIVAATEELEQGDDGWREKGERAKCLRAYILRVNNYVDGTPYEPTSQGLFAKIGEALSVLP